MRIWLQKHTVEGRLPFLDETYRKHVARVLGESAEVRVEGLPEATYAASLPAGIVRYGAAEAMFSWYFAAQAYAAQQAGYDAYAIGAATDPGLATARAVATIPVLGYGETAFFACAERGLRFAVVGCVPELEELLRANVAGYGLGRWLVGFAYLEDGPTFVHRALEGEPAGFLAKFEECARGAIGEGAQVIVPGEGLPNEVLFAAGVSKVGGTPILDGTGLLLASARHQVELAGRGLLPVPEGGAHIPLPAEEGRRLFDLFAPPTIPRSNPA